MALPGFLAFVHRLGHLSVTKGLGPVPNVQPLPQGDEQPPPLLVLAETVATQPPAIDPRVLGAVLQPPVFAHDLGTERQPATEVLLAEIDRMQQPPVLPKAENPATQPAVHQTGAEGQVVQPPPLRQAVDGALKQPTPLEATAENKE